MHLGYPRFRQLVSSLVLRGRLRAKHLFRLECCVNPIFDHAVAKGRVETREINASLWEHLTTAYLRDFEDIFRHLGS